MPIYLITSLFDEGIYSSNFLVVEADSKLEIAAHMLSHPDRWQSFLYHSYARDCRQRELIDLGSLWDCMQDPNMSPQRLLELIDMTYVDGDSGSQLAIHEITIQPLSEINI